MNKSTFWLVASRFAVLVLLFACAAVAADKTNKEALETAASNTISAFYANDVALQELTQRAAGILVFPRIAKGAGSGAAYGEGILRVGGKSVDYYKISDASVGATRGVAERSELVLFMTPAALRSFMVANTWTMGVDARVAVASKGAGGGYAGEALKKPIIAFVFGERGLMADVSLVGARITWMPA